MTRWLTVEQAAERVSRSPDTIYRWARQDLIMLVAGRVLERQLLEADRLKRQRVGRPRATRQKNA